MKFGPIIAMIGMLLVGSWLVWGPLTRIKERTWPDSRLTEVLIASRRGTLEIHLDPQSSGWLFRTHFRDGYVSPILTSDQIEPLIGPKALRQATQSPVNPVLRFFNITSWTNLLWVSIGLAGQVVFSGRMVLQWLISEKRGASTVPVAFWWLSLLGGICLFSYFVWRQDFVGILGQAPGVVIYARNLHLIYRPNPRTTAVRPSPAP